ncbi:FtsX-like permease family protein [Streptantibioticus silvisoli]|uniref:FtsX-like permease family protein n=1 Tax=Streptantibioticus silvisoli TaxID=2705255 RepID=A0ABT6W2J7_9ACTN|nr:FtsX-like permease family protein [Streptantibioticus silvisoli]MDI5964966.1 FtsX-like permease family protein [Streptantibioticus silvisoli]
MFQVVWGRTGPHRALLAAALFAAVLAACVLAALGVYAGAVDRVGIRSALAGQDASSAVLAVSATVTSGQVAAVDRRVRAVAASAYRGLPTATSSSERSGAYGLPAALVSGSGSTSAGGGNESTLFATFDRSEMLLTAGAWPGPDGVGTAAGRAIAVAVPQAAARTLGLRPGSRFSVTDRTNGGPPVAVVVTGVFRPRQPDASYWQLDGLLGHGVSSEGQFTTYGPLVTDPAVFTSGRVGAAAMSWLTTADFRTLGPAGVGPLRGSVQHAVSTLSGHPIDGSTLQARSDLPTTLTHLQQAMRTSDATVLIAMLELAVLALGALLLVSGTLSGARAAEVELLRARGASRRTLAGLALGEAGLLAGPACGVAGLLAVPLAGQLASRGPLAAGGVRIGSAALADAAPWGWAAAAAVAVTCVGVLVGPAVLPARKAGAGQAATRGRRAGGPVALLRAGADLALVALAVVGYLQLRAHTGEMSGLTAGGGGGFALDPVLVVTPALLLLAGAVLAQRLLPPAVRFAERAAARWRGAVPSLAAWQLARRPQRTGLPVLLLGLAVSMGVMAIGQDTSSRQSERDQAAFSVGADVRASDSTLPAFGQGGYYTTPTARRLGITGVDAVNRSDVQLAQGQTATVLAADTRTAAATLRIRPDLLGRHPLAELLRPLHAAQDTPADRERGGFPLPGPGGAQRLRLTVTVASFAPTGRELPSGTAQTITATLEDRYDDTVPLLLGTVPADGRPHVLDADPATAAGAPDGSPAGPLRITRIEADYTPGTRNERQRLTVSTAPTSSIRASDASAPATVAAPASDVSTSAASTSNTSAPAAPAAPVSNVPAADVSAPATSAAPASNVPASNVPASATPAAPASNVPASNLPASNVPAPATPAAPASNASTPTPSAWHAAAGIQIGGDPIATGTAGYVPPKAATPTRAGAGPSFAVAYDLGTAPAAGPGSVLPLGRLSVSAAAPAPPPVNGIATDAFLRATGTSVGKSVQVTLSEMPVTVHLTGAVRQLPTVDPTTGSNGGGLLLDLGAVNRLLDGHQGTAALAPTEWWLATAPGAQSRVATALLTSSQAGTVLTGDGQLTALRADPFAAAPLSALPAEVAGAALLAAAGFVIGAVRSGRERAEEFAVLRALGVPRSGVGRLVAAQQGVLTALALVAGLVLGTVLTRLLVPLTVFTAQATAPVPPPRVELPVLPLAALTAAVVAVPLLVVAVTAVRRRTASVLPGREGVL